MLVAFSVAPSGARTAAIRRAADDAQCTTRSPQRCASCASRGLPHRTTSMFTEIEGEWDEVFDVVKRATEAVLPFGSRVSLVLKADIRPGYTGELDGKIERLEAALDGSTPAVVRRVHDAGRSDRFESIRQDAADRASMTG